MTFWQKNVSKLKFRHVQDSSSWMMKPYAVSLMMLLRDLMQAVKTRYPQIKEIDSINGANVSNEMRELKFTTGEFKFFVSSDMSSAYSNIYKKDVFKAIVLITKLIGVHDWRRDILLKLTELILDSNYIESSAGVYKFSDCLPMGSSASQDCLNIVAMAEELELLEGISAQPSVEANVDENFKVTVWIGQEISEKNSLTRQEKQTLKLFKRYIDDTHEVVSGDNLEVAKAMLLKSLTTYPKNLVMNTTLSLKCFSHLDCAGYTGFSKDKMTTFVRRNYTAPINMVSKSSNCPDSNKHSIIMSEMLRYRRLCSSQTLVELNERQLLTELCSAGYSRFEIKSQMQKNKEYIANNYSSNYIKQVSVKENEETIFGGKITFDDYSGRHKILKCLLRGGGKSRIRPVVVPSLKIKTYLISRKQHLKRLRNFINNN